MRSILTFAALALVAAVATPKLIEHVRAMKPESAAVAMKADAPPVHAAPATYSSRSVVIVPDRQGHFRVEARVDGRRLDFMVDTGASVIALTAKDAARLGIRPARSEHTATVKTANGSIKAAPAQLSAVEVDGITVRDVPALVLPDEALSENLLGLSFLSRLRRFEYARGKLVLEQ
ncbi:MAG: TIGR02281 family clan AA aspartic protease [Rhizobiales bacterium]|nr:TIGR02281 family clan AA aspartic protease [Hyphomicrobiales bacterium]